MGLLVIIFCMFLTLCAINYMQILYMHFRKAKIYSELKNNQCAVELLPQAPGPFPLPIIGNLNVIARYTSPFAAFTELTKEYGDIYSLTFGNTRCLIVNNFELIRNVLNQNGKYFGDRPNFLRYHELFGGDRNNSLALCDWSSLQQKRRNLARRHCSPRISSSYFKKMSTIGASEVKDFLEELQARNTVGEPVPIKQLIQQACANMFSQYMCSVRFDYDDLEFQKIVYYFDEIFWEINEGYALDFLPYLAPFYKKHLNKIKNWSATIREFILKRIIVNREQNIDLDAPEHDFTDALLKSLSGQTDVSRETIIFMLEDFIGGHSAVGNLVMLCLTYVALNPHIGHSIQKEADSIVNEKAHRSIDLDDMESMPFTVATIFEVLRFSSSPIVPHVATQDIKISNFGVTTGTIVFVNNYILNTSEKYWTNPQEFDPERFLDRIPVGGNNFEHLNNSKKRRNSYGSDSGIEFECESHKTAAQYGAGTSLTNYKTSIKKNIPHFLPFSIGRRTCIGQNLVRGFGFILLSNILLKFHVSSHDISSIIVKPSCVALPPDTFPLLITPRVNES